MNQTAIGSYIARKRREQNLTQEQLVQWTHLLSSQWTRSSEK